MLYLSRDSATRSHSTEYGGERKYVSSHVVAVLASKVQATRGRGNNLGLSSKNTSVNLLSVAYKFSSRDVAHEIECE